MRKHECKNTKTKLKNIVKGIGAFIWTIGAIYYTRADKFPVEVSVSMKNRPNEFNHTTKNCRYSATYDGTIQTIINSKMGDYYKNAAISIIPYNAPSSIYQAIIQVASSSSCGDYYKLAAIQDICSQI